jgi:hypothetical protein
MKIHACCEGVVSTARDLVLEASCRLGLRELPLPDFDGLEALLASLAGDGDSPPLHGVLVP